jgi:hypothetical protein
MDYYSVISMKSCHFLQKKDITGGLYVKRNVTAVCWGTTSVILATWKAEIRRITV